MDVISRKGIQGLKTSLVKGYEAFGLLAGNGNPKVLGFPCVRIPWGNSECFQSPHSKYSDTFANPAPTHLHTDVKNHNILLFSFIEN